MEEPSFWKSDIRTARTSKVCAECGRKISTGDRYRDDRGVWDGLFDNFALCVLCDSLYLSVLLVVDAHDIEYGGLHDIAEELELWARIDTMVCAQPVPASPV